MSTGASAGLTAAPAEGAQTPAALTPGPDGAIGLAGWIAVGAVSIANLVPVWGLRYFPGQDTANHLYAAEVLRQIAGGVRSPLTRTFVATLGVKSNMAFHVLVLALLHLLDLTTAHRLLLSAYAVALPLAGLYCVRQAAPRNRTLALLLLPLAWSWFAVQGLYNYVFSLVPALVGLGIVARDGGRPKGRAAIGLAACGLAVYFCHVGTFVAMLFVTTVRVLLPGDGSRGRIDRRIVEAWPVVAALAPALVVAAFAFLAGLGAPHAALEPTVSRLEMSDVPLALGTFFLEFALRFRPWEILFLLPPLVLLLGVPLHAAWRRGRPLQGDAAVPSWPLVAALSLTVLYFVLPHILLGSDANPRLRPIIVFALLCYRGVHLPTRARRRVAIAALACGLGGAAALTAIGARIDRELDDFTSGIPYVREGARLYPMVFDPRSPSVLIRPFLHAWGYYGLSRHVVTPFAFAWHESRFPLRYRELPLHRLDGDLPSDGEDEPYALEQGRLCRSVRRYAPSRTCDDIRAETLDRLASLGARYDYVLTWAAPHDFAALLAARGFTLLHAQGRMALFAAPRSLVLK